MQPIRWIGTRSYDGRFIAGNHMALPVCIRRHALGHNMPSRDLYLSPDHSLCEGGVLVYAWRFINGVSIRQAAAVERVDYFHIELDRHAVIFANNLPVESFLDAECRARFLNAQGAPVQVPQTPCLPRVRDGYYLARLKARIDARAGIAAPCAAPGVLRGHIDEAGPRWRGWAQDAAAPEVPVELELLCGGQAVLRFLANRYRDDLRAAGLGSGCHAFELAVPGLQGAVTLRRVSDGAVLGGTQAARRAG
jgi:Hint domain